jgi:predicted ABC-type ATPase
VASKIVALFIGTNSYDINIARCKNRENEGADKVSIEKIKGRYKEALNRIVEFTAIAEKIYFIDNSITKPRVVSYSTKRDFLVLDKDCQWFNRNLKNKLLNI